MKHVLTAGVLCWLTAVMAGEAPQWRVLPEESNLSFEFREAGTTESGAFRRFDATFWFDPARPEQGRFKVIVDMASVDTGDDERDRMLCGADLFHVERWAESHFKTLDIEHRGGDRYLARAELTIRDETRRLDFPFTLRFAGSDGGQTFILESDIILHRLDFGVGQGEWRETSMVKDEVRVMTRIEAVRRGFAP